MPKLNSNSLQVKTPPPSTTTTMSKLNANAEPFVPRAVAAAATSKLNANAQPFTAVKQQGRSRTWEEDERSLFMTFSSGSPLTEKEIFKYFTRRFGKCVEYVYVHEHEQQKKEPEFGKITFKTSSLPEMILLNKKVVKFWVNNKPIWLKKYVPRTQRKLMAQKSF